MAKDEQDDAILADAKRFGHFGWDDFIVIVKIRHRKIITKEESKDYINRSKL